MAHRRRLWARLALTTVVSGYSVAETATVVSRNAALKCGNAGCDISCRRPIESVDGPGRKCRRWRWLWWWRGGRLDWLSKNWLRTMAAGKLQMLAGGNSGNEDSRGWRSSIRRDMAVTSVSRMAVPTAEISGGAPTTAVSRTTTLAFIFRRTELRSEVVLIYNDSWHGILSIYVATWSVVAFRRHTNARKTVNKISSVEGENRGRRHG